MKNGCFALFCLLTLFVRQAAAQQCPDNIDFANGNFTNWVCSTGKVDRQGIISLSADPDAVPGRQTLVSNRSVERDPFGNFSVVAPNGAANTLILGNSVGGADAEQVAYTYTIPADKPNYTFTYYYAVVLQLTAHANFERPRFSVKLTDVTTREVISCGTHDFVSGDGLGDFQKSASADVEYRDWSTVSVNLAGRQGHTVKFEFTTNDCVYVQHFGYAYLSFDNPCETNNEPISGSNYCNGLNNVVLTAPPGFGRYSWHETGKTDIIGFSRQLILQPVPADGTKYTVDVESTSGVGQGCPASFSATVHKVDEDYIFNLQTKATACKSVGVDLTNRAITAGSAPGMKFKYFEDAGQNVVIRDPTLVTKTGVYWVQGTNRYGCTDIKSIFVELIDNPAAKINHPKPVCKPAVIDLTDPAITDGIIPGLTYQYFMDEMATRPMANPKAVSTAGTYYLKLTNSQGCTQVLGINAEILDIPFIKSASYVGCSPFNVTLPVYRAADLPGLTYMYYKDAAATIPVNNPDKITEEGTIYAVGVNQIGCTTPAPVAINISLNPLAAIEVENISPVKFPATVDLTACFKPQTGYTYKYYKNEAATIAIADATHLTETGTYYIRAINAEGCDIIKPVKVVVNPPDEAAIIVKNTFTPNGDGINDEFVPTLRGVARTNWLKIFSRNGGLVFETKDLNTHWRGQVNGSVTTTGTYYWVFSGYDTYRKQQVYDSGSVTIVK